MKRFMLIFQLFFALYFNFQFLYQLYSGSCHVYNFISYLLLDISLIYFGFATILSCMSHASYQRSDLDIHLSRQIYQKLVILLFQLACNSTRHLSRQTQPMTELWKLTYFHKRAGLSASLHTSTGYSRILYHALTSGQTASRFRSLSYVYANNSLYILRSTYFNGVVQNQAKWPKK